MAQSIADIIGKMKTSIHGRRLGIDQTGRLTGVLGTRYVVTDATSATTGTNLPNHGVVTLDSTTGDTYTLTDPEAGCMVTIVSICTGGVNTVNGDNATFMSSASSTAPGMTFTGGTAAATLVGATTALWVVAATHGTSAATHVTTA
jgi:hypothetical protein